MAELQREPWASLADRFVELAHLRWVRRRRIPYVQQTTPTDCGAACLAMVLGYHGKNLSLSEVREQAGIGRQGIDAAKILETARHFSLQGRGIRFDDIDTLQYLDPGSILHWRFNHFVVFERFLKRGIWVVNPTIGRQFVPRDELDRSFTGVALTFAPGEDFEEEATKHRGAKRYLHRVLQDGRFLIRILVLSAFIHLMILAIPVLTGLIVDRVVPREDLRLLTVLAVGVAGAVAFNFLAHLVRSFLLLHLKIRLDARLSLEFLDHMMDLPYLFFLQRSTGDLMTRLSSNFFIREFLTSGVLSAMLDGLMVSIYLLLLLFANPKIGLLVAALGLLRIGLFVGVRTNVRDLMSQALVAQAQTRGYSYQMLSGIETLKAAGTEQNAVQAWSKLFINELNVSLDRGRLDVIVNSLLDALRVASPLGILLFGSYLVIQGELSLGMMLALNALALGFLTPISALVSTAFQLQLMASYIQRIEDVLEAPRENVGDSLQRVTKLAGRITVEEVTFCYAPTSPPALRKISLTIPAGGFVAIVGESGSGKSTLAGLLAGLYLPDSGRILYDGIDIAGIDLRSLRKLLGFVPQQPYLFATSIRKNIALTDPGMALPHIIEAARLACIHQDIMAMPMRYESPLAENGASLSGGQRQRIALAQALVRQPKVIILDEATSALDAKNEQRVYENLHSLRSTRVVIAHRLSTVRRADQILVMDSGQVVEQGTHSELLALAGKYRVLVEAQLQTDNREGSASVRG